MEKKKTWDVYIPGNVSVESIIPTTLRKDAFKARVDSAHYILSLLIPNVNDHKKMKQFTSTGFIQLDARTVQNVVGTKYKEVITLLQQNGIIEINHHFKIGHFSMSYRITDVYLTPPKQVEITNSGMKKRYYDYISNKKRKQQRRIRKHAHHLVQWINHPSLKHDVEMMHNFVEWHTFKMRQVCAQHPFETESKRREAEVRIRQSMESQKELIAQFESGDRVTSIDDAGRFYNPIVSIKKEHRYYLTFNGQQLYLADIRASQPYLFQVLMKRSFWGTSSRAPITLYKTNRELYKRLKESGTIHEVITLLTSYKSEAGIEFENRVFSNHDWVTSDYYLMLQRRMTGVKGLNRHFKDRDACKQASMYLLFGWFHEQHQPKYYQAFKEAFPLEVGLMDVIKKASKKKGDELSTGSDILALLLQSIEAEVMIRRVTKRISRSHPHIPLYSIHDAVASTSEHIRFIGEELSKELAYITGKEPSIKYEVLNKNTPLDELERIVTNDWRELLKKMNKPKKNKRWYEGYSPRLVAPVLYKLPEWINTRLLSTRYIDTQDELWIDMQEELEKMNETLN